MRTPRSARRERGKRAAASAEKRAANEAERAKERYEAIAERMHEVKKEEERAAMRYVAWCEQVLGGETAERTAKPGADAAGAVEELEQGLYRHMDAVERVGGELKRRWQHCLAEVVVRGMQNDK